MGGGGVGMFFFYRSMIDLGEEMRRGGLDGV